MRSYQLPLFFTSLNLQLEFVYLKLLYFYSFIVSMLTKNQQTSQKENNCLKKHNILSKRRYSDFSMTSSNCGNIVLYHLVRMSLGL